MIEHSKGQRMIRMELKYCERCGGLLLRRAGEAVVYCGSCEAQMRELPVPAARRSEAAEAGMLEQAEKAKPEQPNEFHHGAEVGAVPKRIPPQRATLPRCGMNPRRFA